MPRRKDIAFDESFFSNMDDYYIFKARFYDLACGCFNFENLDDNIFKPFVINKLIMLGKVLAFEDPDLFNDEGKPTFFLYPYTNNGILDMYNQPKSRKVVFMNNSATYDRTDKDSVILRCNVSGTSLMKVIESFARTIYLINRTIQINVNAQKTPIALVCDENTRLSYENLLKQYLGNVPFIFGSKDIDINQLKSINLQSPYVADRLYQLMENYWNQFLTFFGIPNISMNKKERLITDEVQRSMGGVLIAKQNFENQIQEDISRINKMFNKDIKFTWGVKDENINYSLDDTIGQEYNDINNIKEGGSEE